MTCHVWRKPINHPWKISVWNHHLEKTEHFCWTSQHVCAQITTFSIFLPLWWLPVTLKIWRMDTDAKLMPVEKVSPASYLFDYFFRYLWATVNCSGEHLNSPPPENEASSNAISFSNHQFWGICFLQYHCFKIQNMSFSSIQHHRPPRLLST